MCKENLSSEAQGVSYIVNDPAKTIAVGQDLMRHEASPITVELSRIHHVDSLDSGALRLFSDRIRASLGENDRALQLHI